MDKLQNHKVYIARYNIIRSNSKDVVEARDEYTTLSPGITAAEGLTHGYTDYVEY